MKRPVAVEASRPEADATGLPFFRTWKRVYLLVLGSFALWLGLLMALTKIFS
jgi:hypothetical protein